MDNLSYRRVASRPDSSFFLFGPRGVGKSTWSREVLPEARRFDLLSERLYHDLLSDPGLFADELRTVPKESWVVVDEVQRLPQLLNEVHRFIEERGLRFALLGSSARKLRAAGTNLLAGRAQRLEMFPLLPEELGDEFSLESALCTGTVALVVSSENKTETLEAYIQTYLREEIRAEALVRNLPGFARFLAVAALTHGQVTNISSLAREAGVARTTVGGYVEILEDTLLAKLLPGFEARLRVRERRHPKLYWIDPGVVRAIKRQLGPVTIEERGPLLEGWVFTLLRAYGEHRGLFDDVFYWASSQGRSVEVDFLLRREQRLLAIEVKSSRRYLGRMAAGLRAIGELDRVVRRVLVYEGERTLRTEDGIEVWPVEVFLAALAGDRLWP